MIVYSDAGSSFFRRDIRDSSYSMPGMHVHNKHELYFLEEGGTKYFVGNEIYILKPGDFIFVPKDVFHMTDKFECDSYTRILMVFDDDYIGEEYLKYVDFLKEKKCIRIPSSKLYRFYDIFAKLEHETQHRSKDYEELYKLYLREILVLMSRYQTFSEDFTELNDSYQLVQNAAEYISRNYDSDLSLELLSQKFSLSKSYFSRLFKEVTGVGVSEYINISRISIAEKLLAQGNLSITEVANRCGFNDSNYFATVFKKIKGISPKKYSLSV